jgi:hypothetical protein
MSFAVTGPKGVPAPTAMFAVTPATLTVPAGGQAAVQVTANTRGEHPAGVYGGSLVATADGAVVQRTPVGLELQPQEFNLTLNNIDRSGKPTYLARVIIASLDTDFIEAQDSMTGTSVRRRLPKGRYLVSSTVMDLNPTRAVTALTYADLSLGADTVLDMDARLGKPVSVGVTKPGAVQTGGYVNVTATVGAGETFGYGIGGPFDEVFSAGLGTGSTKHVDSKVSAYFARRQADGATTNSPWTVAVALSEPHTILDGYTRVVQERELATVQNDFAASAAGKSAALKTNYPSWPRLGRDEWGAGNELALPGRRTDYYASEGGVAWDVEFDNEVAGAFDWAPDILVPMMYFDESEKVYQAGRTYHESWNKGVFGPAFPVKTRPGQQGLTRIGNMLDIAASVYSDDQSRLGSAALVGRFGRLTRDGVVLYQGNATGGHYDVPAGDAEYKLLINTGRLPLNTLSTQNQVTWTFRSAEAPADTATKLPVSVVRFTPDLDDHNRAGVGGWDLIPFTVQRQGGAKPASTTGLEIEVSYDDGRTWRPAIVQRNGEYGAASIVRPTGMTSGFVSIQSRATLSDGGMVEQKIVRAFAF